MLVSDWSNTAFHDKVFLVYFIWTKTAKVTGHFNVQHVVCRSMHWVKILSEPVRLKSEELWSHAADQSSESCDVLHFVGGVSFICLASTFIKVL